MSIDVWFVGLCNCFMLIPYESFFIQSHHQHGHLISEQNPGELHPLFQLGLDTIQTHVTTWSIITGTIPKPVPTQTWLRPVTTCICKPGAANKELLMMSSMPLETRWAFNERWNNKFCYKVAPCWLFLPSHTTMHGSMNIRFIRNFSFTQLLHSCNSEPQVYEMYFVPCQDNKGNILKTFFCTSSSKG